MAFDFTATDMKSHFTIDAAAIAWCEIENLEDCKNLPFLQMRSALLQAVKDGDLDAQIPEKIVEKRIRGSLYDMAEPDYERASIARKDLKTLALTHGVKPKFLFPEMRKQEPALAISDVAAIVAEAPIHANQKRIAAWKAEAQVIWNEHPEYTQGQVAAIIRANMLENKKGGYSGKAIIRAIAALDPRENRVGRRKKQLIDS